MRRTGKLLPVPGHLLKKRRKAFFLRELSVQITLHHRHFILGQRPRLVRADHLHRTQRLHRREPAHNGLCLYHAGHAQRQHDRHNGRQTLRHGGHGQRDGSQKHIPHIPLLQQSHDKEQHTDPHRQCAQYLPEFSQPYLQRRQFFLMPMQHVRYMTNPGVHARGCYNAEPAPLCHISRHVDHVPAACIRRLFLHIARLFFYGHRLSRKGRLFRKKSYTFNQSQVSRHPIPGLQDHNISRHQFLRRNIVMRAIPQNRCSRFRYLL